MTSKLIIKSAMFNSIINLAIFLSTFSYLMAEKCQADFRANLAENGIEFGVEYLGEVFSITNGGLDQKSEYLHLVNTPVNIDLEKGFSLEGGSLYLNSQWTYGGSPTEHAGDLQTISNNDAEDTWKLYEAWYQQILFDEKLSLLIGLFDLNLEFDVIERSGMFINSSFGIGPDYSQSGENGPSIFPTTSLAFRAAFQPLPQLTTRFALFDGVPGDPENPKGIHIKFGADDGLLLAGEIDYSFNIDKNNRLAVGGWHYTSESLHIIGDPDKLFHNQGAYALTEFSLWSDSENSRRLDIFARGGVAQDEVNQIGSYFGCGVVLTNFISSSFENSIGLAVATAANGEDFEVFMNTNDLTLDDSETVFELTGQFVVHQYLTFQPDLQYIINPGTDPDIENALALGLRVIAGI